MDISDQFSKNLGKALAHQRLNASSAAKAWGLPHKTIESILKQIRSPGLRTAETVAKACGYELWQMLQPEFDPGNPPVLRVITRKEEALYERLRQLAKELPDVSQ
jgi:hypothetical protein